MSKLVLATVVLATGRVELATGRRPGAHIARIGDRWWIVNVLWELRDGEMEP
jgi:hypothetical protein